MNDVNRQLVLARRPVGAVEDSDFELRETDVPEPGPGEFLARVRCGSHSIRPSVDG